MTEAEFTHIVSESKRAVLASARRYLSPDLSAYLDDVVQETYIKAYYALKSKRSLDEVKSMETYLYTITKHLCFRFNQKHRRLNTEELSPSIAIIEGENVDEKMILEEKIAMLPAAFQSVVKLVRDGWLFKDIAKKLNIKEGTVKSRFSRAKQALAGSVKSGGDV